MVAVTYGVAASAVVDSKRAVKKKGLFAMLFKAIADSQMKKAEREIARYRYLLPRDGDEPLPFDRR